MFLRVFHTVGDSFEISYNGPHFSEGGRRVPSRSTRRAKLGMVRQPHRHREIQPHHLPPQVHPAAIPAPLQRGLPRQRSPAVHTHHLQHQPHHRHRTSRLRPRRQPAQRGLRGLCTLPSTQKRHRKDWEINSRTTRILRDGEFVET